MWPVVQHEDHQRRNEVQVHAAAPRALDAEDGSSPIGKRPANTFFPTELAV